MAVSTQARDASRVSALLKPKTNGERDEKGEGSLPPPVSGCCILPSHGMALSTKHAKGFSRKPGGMNIIRPIY